MRISLSPIRESIKSKIITNTKRTHRLNHYNSLVNILCSSGMVPFNGQVYKSVADLTIDFFKATKS